MRAGSFLLTLLIVLCAISCSDKTTENHNTVAKPTFEPEAGPYFNPVYVQIICTTPEAVIRFTVDGTEPDTNDELYVEPIYVLGEMTIRAVAFKDGMEPSNTATATYSILSTPPDLLLHFNSITAEPDTIYADGGLTHSTITATVRNGINIAVEGETVQFNSTCGTILGSAVTNEFGQASASFSCDLPAISTIKAVVQKFHPDYPNVLVSSDTTYIQVVVASVPPISEINLTLPSSADPYFLMLMESITVSATPINILNEHVPDNTMIGFTVSIGYFEDAEGNPLGSSISVPAIGGTAQVNFNAGPTPGNGVIVAELVGVTDSRNIIVNP